MVRKRDRAQQSEAIDENRVDDIRTHEALNSTVLEPRVPTRVTAVLCAPVCASHFICERALQSRCEALHLSSHACAEGAPCCTGRHGAQSSGANVPRSGQRDEPAAKTESESSRAFRYIVATNCDQPERERSRRVGEASDLRGFG